MKIMPCPLNGPRNIQEFVCAGPVEPHPDPNRCTDDEWAEYVWLEENEAGLVREWWCHVATSYWFIAERNTVTDEILATYPASQVFSERVDFEPLPPPPEAAEAKPEPPQEAAPPPPPPEAPPAPEPQPEPAEAAPEAPSPTDDAAGSVTTADEAPADAASAEAASGDVAPAEDAPAEDAPAEDASSDDAAPSEPKESAT